MIYRQYISSSYRRGPDRRVPRFQSKPTEWTSAEYPLYSIASALRYLRMACKGEPSTNATDMPKQTILICLTTITCLIFVAYVYITLNYRKGSKLCFIIPFRELFSTCVYWFGSNFYYKNTTKTNQHLCFHTYLFVCCAVMRGSWKL